MDNHDKGKACDRKCVNGTRPEVQKSRSQVQTTKKVPETKKKSNPTDADKK